VYVFPAATHSPWLQAWPLHGVGAGGGAVTTTGGAGAGASSSPPRARTATTITRTSTMTPPIIICGRGTDGVRGSARSARLRAASLLRLWGGAAQTLLTRQDAAKDGQRALRCAHGTHRRAAAFPILFLVVRRVGISKRIVKLELVRHGGRPAGE
jgi:hypothetical protein